MPIEPIGIRIILLATMVLLAIDDWWINLNVELYFVANQAGELLANIM